MGINLRPPNEAAFERVHSELLASYEQWASKRHREAALDVADMALHYRWSSGDRDLGEWNCGQLTALLFDVVPRTVAVDIAAKTITGLHDFVDFLADERILRDGDPPALLHEFLDEHADEFAEVANEPRRFSPGKAIATAMAEDGVDPIDADGARAWLEEFNALPLSERKKVLPDEMFETPLELPRIRLPLKADLAEAAAVSGALERLREFVSFVGDGRKLTNKGNITLADTKAFADVIGLRPDPDFAWRSSERIPEVGGTFRWARRAGFVRVVKGRVLATKRGRNIGRDRLDDWERAFGALLSIGVLDLGYPWHAIPHMIDHEVEGILLHIYIRRDPVEADSVGDLAWQLVDDAFDLPALAKNVWEEFVHHDVDKIFERLEELGAVRRLETETRTNIIGTTEVRGGRVELTGLGLWAMHRRLIESGYDAPATGELVDATATQLLSVCTILPPEVAVEEVAVWCETRADALEQLAAELRATADPKVRLIGLHALAELGPHGIRVVGELAEDARCGPMAKATLAARGDQPGSLLDASSAPEAMVDALATIMTVDGERAVAAELAQLGRSDEQIAVVSELWRAKSPFTEGILEAIGRHHPSRDVAKAARRALFKRRSS